MEHHAKCMCAQAWDVEQVPCSCPRGWPRASKKTRWTFSVPGLAATKGSTRSFVSRGRVVTKADCDRLKPWSKDVAYVALANCVQLAPKGTAVRVSVTFVLKRPRKTGAAAHYSVVRPDVDKLTRALLDALTGIAYHDDGQVAMTAAHKVLAPRGEEPRTEVLVEWL